MIDRVSFQPMYTRTAVNLLWWASKIPQIRLYDGGEQKQHLQITFRESLKPRA